MKGDGRWATGDGRWEMGDGRWMMRVPRLDHTPSRDRASGRHLCLCCPRGADFHREANRSHAAVFFAQALSAAGSSTLQAGVPVNIEYLRRYNLFHEMKTYAYGQYIRSDWLLAAGQVCWSNATLDDVAADWVTRINLTSHRNINRLFSRIRGLHDGSGKHGTL